MDLQDLRPLSDVYPQNLENFTNYLHDQHSLSDTYPWIFYKLAIYLQDLHWKMNIGLVQTYTHKSYTHKIWKILPLVYRINTQFWMHTHEIWQILNFIYRIYIEKWTLVFFTSRGCWIYKIYIHFQIHTPMTRFGHWFNSCLGRGWWIYKIYIHFQTHTLVIHFGHWFMHQWRLMDLQDLQSLSHTYPLDSFWIRYTKSTGEELPRHG